VTLDNFVMTAVGKNWVSILYFHLWHIINIMLYWSGFGRNIG